MSNGVQEPPDGGPPMQLVGAPISSLPPPLSLAPQLAINNQSTIGTSDTSDTSDIQESSKDIYLYTGIDIDNNEIKKYLNINELIAKIKLHNDKGNIYILISNKKNARLQTFSIYINQPYNTNNREKDDTRYNEAIKKFQNACAIFKKNDCVIISYAKDFEPSVKLIDFDDDLEILFGIGFKRFKNALTNNYLSPSAMQKFQKIKEDPLITNTPNTPNTLNTQTEPIATSPDTSQLPIVSANDVLDQMNGNPIFGKVLKNLPDVEQLTAKNPMLNNLLQTTMGKTNYLTAMKEIKTFQNQNQNQNQKKEDPVITNTPTTQTEPIATPQQPTLKPDDVGVARGGKKNKGNIAKYILEDFNIPYKKNGKLDFVTIQKIGRGKNKNFTIHKIEKDDLKNFTKNYKNNNHEHEQYSFNESIEKIKKLLSGVNFKIVNKRGGFDPPIQTQIATTTQTDLPIETTTLETSPIANDNPNEITGDLDKNINNFLKNLENYFNLHGNSDNSDNSGNFGNFGNSDNSDNSGNFGNSGNSGNSDNSDNSGNFGNFGTSQLPLTINSAGAAGAADAADAAIQKFKEIKAKNPKIDVILNRIPGIKDINKGMDNINNLSDAVRKLKAEHPNLDKLLETTMGKKYSSAMKQIEKFKKEDPVITNTSTTPTESITTSPTTSQPPITPEGTGVARGGKKNKGNIAKYILKDFNIPYKKNGKLDFVTIQKIGRGKNKNFTIHKIEKDDLESINIDFLSNYKCDPPIFDKCSFNKSVVIRDVIPKLRKLLDGVNYKIEEKDLQMKKRRI